MTFGTTELTALTTSSKFSFFPPLNPTFCCAGFILRIRGGSQHLQTSCRWKSRWDEGVSWKVLMLSDWPEESGCGLKSEKPVPPGIMDLHEWKGGSDKLPSKMGVVARRQRNRRARGKAQMFATFAQLKINDDILYAGDSYPWLQITVTCRDYKKRCMGSNPRKAKSNTLSGN